MKLEYGSYARGPGGISPVCEGLGGVGYIRTLDCVPSPTQTAPVDGFCGIPAGGRQVKWVAKDGEMDFRELDDMGYGSTSSGETNHRISGYRR